MFFSDRWYTMLDYAPGEFAAAYASWRERLHPDDRAPAEAAVQAHLDGRSPEYSVECRMQAKCGDWRWVNARGKVVERDAAGKPLRMVGTHVDIDARKRAEKALRLAQLSIRYASDAVFWITPSGRFVEVNEQACNSLGFTRDELLSMAVWDIDPDFSEARWPPHWERTRQQPADVTDDEVLLALWHSNHARALAGEVVEEEVCLGVGDAQRYIHHVIAPIRDGAAICGVVGVNIDITDRKRVEAELQRYREHLEDVVRERTIALARTNADLRQAMEHLVQTEKLAALGHLVAGVAHELNTPLGSARRRSFDLRQTVDEVLMTLHPVLKGSRHQVEVDIPSGLELDSYPGPLEQVLVNLVGNSLLHGFAGIDAKCVRLVHTDNGVGIPAATLTRVFDPFFTTRLGQGGSGLGLYIVYNVVTGVLGGSIKVDSLPGRGTSFTLTLPRTAPERQGAVNCVATLPLWQASAGRPVA